MEILDSDDPGLRYYIDQRLPAHLAAAPRRTCPTTPTPASATAAGTPRWPLDARVRRSGARPPLPLWQEKLQLFRAVDDQDPERCVPTFGRRHADRSCQESSVASITVPPFQMVSDFDPAGDQPTRHRGADGEHHAGRPLPDASRHHRLGEERHDRLDDRAGAEAHPGAGPEQVAGRAAGQRVPRVLPAQPRGVLRLLLRLLPTRGLHRLVRHVHREGLVGERRDRPAPPRLHLGAPDPHAT